MSEQKAAGFTIFREKDAPKLVDSGVMTMAPITDTQRAGLTKAVKAGYTEGDEVQILVDLPGFALAHAWLKKDYPLALHSHDGDCLYYVVAGTLKLGPRDSFFVPAGTPDTYRPGPDGVEVLEIRHQGRFDFVNLSRSEAFWNRAAETIAANLDGWRTAHRPSLNAPREPATPDG